MLDRINKLVESYTQRKSNINTEEATKHSLILPFIQILGYNPFDIGEVYPEYTADFGTKQGEKVDYAILKDGQPVIIIEAKSANTALCEKHMSQLYRYFNISSSKYAILTNGLEYQLFTDSEEINKMDIQPFYRFNITTISKEDISFLNGITKSNMDTEKLKRAAIAIKYQSKVTNFITALLTKPNKRFIEMVAKECGIGSYLGTNDIASLISNSISFEISTATEASIELTTDEVDKEEIGYGKHRELANIDISKIFTLGEVDPYGYRIDYAIVNGTTYDDINFPGLIVTTLEEINKKDNNLLEQLLEDRYFETNKYDKISRDSTSSASMKKLTTADVYVDVRYGSTGALKFIEKILERAGITSDFVKIKFKNKE